MKPIEQGCKAMIINSRAGNNGKIVTPVKYIGKLKYYEKSDIWELEEKINVIVETNGVFSNYMRETFISESNLMRIDGFEPETEQHNETKMKEPA